jgi:hypothetical protein
MESLSHLPERNESSLSCSCFICENVAKDHDEEVTVYVAGGVVRTILSFLYQEIYNKMNNSEFKGTTAEDVLDEIAGQKVFMPVRVLGVRSDLDILPLVWFQLL